MGVTGGRDFFSSKYITAMIFDEQSRMHLVPIKKPIADDFFLAKINNELYCFRIDNRRIKIWYQTVTKSFRILLYTTKHYLPISPEHNKELEVCIEKNALPKMNKMLYVILSTLGKTEKRKFTPHRVDALIENLGEREDAHAENVRNIKTFLEDLSIDEIVTPVRDITDFIYEDLIATDPKFLGSVPGAILEAENESRKVTNSPLGSKHAWFKWIIVFGMIAVVGGLAFWLFTQGGGGDKMPDFLSFLPGTSTGPTVEQLQAQYPTPEALKSAVDAGRVDPTQLPDWMRKSIEKIQLPTLTPTVPQNHQVNIGE